MAQSSASAAEVLFFYGGAAWLPLSWQVWLAGAFNMDGFLQTSLVASAALLLFAGGLLGAMRYSQQQRG